MNVPKVYPIRKLLQKAKQRGIGWFSGGKHGKFKGPDSSGRIQAYPLPSVQHKKEVSDVYLKGFLRRFGLDETFFND
jgi:hypothetical protein